MSQHTGFLGWCDARQSSSRDWPPRGRVFGAVLALALLFSTGCQTPRSVPLSSQAVAPAPVQLAPGDVVKLTFPGAPELNQTQKIRADGKISLPLVGEISAGGKRPAALQEELKNVYKAQLTNSEVLVTLESGTIAVFLSGAVKKPGKLVFDRPMNLLEVITEAGGFTPQANVSKVRVIRLVKGVHQSQLVDLKPALSGRTTDAFFVRPNDVIIVGENFLNF